MFTEIPVDFFLRGYLKSKVYVNTPYNLDDRNRRIGQEIILIGPQVIENVHMRFMFY